MSNVGRILTIRVKITDHEASKWLWDAHVKGPINGVIVEALANGDLLEQVFDVESETVSVPKKYFVWENGETLEEAIEAHCYGGFDSLTEANLQASNCVSPGSRYKIADQTGHVYLEGILSEEKAK